MQLAHLPDRTREYVICGDDDGDGSLDPEVPVQECANANNLHETVKDDKKSKKKGMLGWFKSRVIISPIFFSSEISFLDWHEYKNYGLTNSLLSIL